MHLNWSEPISSTLWVFQIPRSFLQREKLLQSHIRRSPVNHCLRGKYTSHAPGIHAIWYVRLEKSALLYCFHNTQMLLFCKMLEILHPNNFTSLSLPPRMLNACYLFTHNTSPSGFICSDESWLNVPAWVPL